MNSARNTFATTLCLCSLTILLSGQPLLAQQPTNTPTPDDVLKIKTELVQTGISVFDKQGHFVEGLTKQDFELRLDGRTVPISFFENILTGSQRDRAARSPDNEPTPVRSSPSELTFRQRTIVFFIDDRHLSLDSVGRTRKMLSNFLDKEMGPNDLVAIASASGQIGFLQQFTDNKEVLRAAVARLNHKANTITDFGGNTGTPMTEYMALTIEKRDDPNVFQFYVEDCIKWAPRSRSRQQTAGSRAHCEIEVQNRARQVLLQAGTVTSATYYSLEILLHSAERMPGSKLAFFISDGFLADTGPRGPVAGNQLNRITDRARRAGVVIYTVDARGLVSGANSADGSIPVDPNGRLESANLREIAASQDALNALAGDTGGRALRNQNYFDHFINDALAETSRYYLLAWRPDPNTARDEIKKIEVSVIGHPELTVRSARTFVQTNTFVAVPNEKRHEQEKKQTPKPEKKVDVLQEALENFYPTQTLPLQLSLIYVDTPANGSVLTSSVQAPGQLLSYGDNDNDPAQISIVGVILNDEGKPVQTFKTGLSVKPPKNGQQDTSNVIYNYPSPVKPGIYQVRVAARDDRSGKVGSVMQWIVIPDLSTRQLSLSSLIVGLEDVKTAGGDEGRSQWSVDRTFARNSRLNFLIFVYNAALGVQNQLNARVQVFKDGQAVVTPPVTLLNPSKQSDRARVPFNGEVNLAGLQSGDYVLEVTIEDRASQKTVSQHCAFYVE